MKTISFTFGGQLCIETLDGYEFEYEIGPERYRALYEQNSRGLVTMICFDRNDARDGKPDYWVNNPSLPIEVQRKVIDQINTEFQAEQRRIAEMEDA
jgi:hypothetical protein